MTRAAIFIALAISSSLPAAEVWIFLKDGRMGWGDPDKNPPTITLPDGTQTVASKDQIQGQRTRADADAAVVAMMQEILRGKNISEHAARFKTLRAAATPKLLEYLKGADARLRLSALFGLQFCFTPDAKEPVLAALKDGDNDVRRTAYSVLMINVPEKELAERLKPFADSEDVSVAALVFETVDKHFPDASLKRIKRLMADPKFHTVFFNRFSHYLSPILTPATLPLLESKNKDVQRAGMVWLVTQLANDDPSREKMRGLLGAADPEVRDLAGEFFSWLGKKSDEEALRRALSKETDPYAKASIEAAINVIGQRETQWAKDSEASSNLAIAQNEQPIEPALIYGVVEPSDKESLRDRLFRLQALLAAPCGNLRDGLAALGNRENTPPVANQFIPPVRDFLDPKRKSYGLEMNSAWSGPFSGSVHVGDDVSWRKELRSVVAIGPGVVRSVEHAFSWGFIVIVEHTLEADRKVCSLYAHLSPMIHVKPGDVVKMGQKIGSIGRNQCVENGGYMAHLHFGLHEGPYSQKNRWVSGYISTEKWKEGGHGWIEPQAFLQPKK